MDLLRAVGKTIQLLRDKKGMTQEELEKRTGINAKYISAIEGGQKNITLSTLDKIAKGLDVEMFEILLVTKGIEPGETARKAIECLLRDADARTLNLCLDFLRKSSG
jgi:transcriptional regulator with XRE-family HTH domain